MSLLQPKSNNLLQKILHRGITFYGINLVYLLGAVLLTHQLNYPTALLSFQPNFSSHFSGIIHIYDSSVFNLLTLDIFQVNTVKETLMSTVRKDGKPRPAAVALNGEYLTDSKWYWPLSPSVFMFSLLFYLRYRDSSLLRMFHLLLDISANRVLFKTDWNLGRLQWGKHYIYFTSSSSSSLVSTGVVSD